MRTKKIMGNDKLHIFLLFMASFFVHAFVLNQFICWFSTDTDGYWLHAATFLGKDWSGVAKHMNNYYSWGYSVLLTIPMLLTDVPSRLCKLAVLINSGLCALIVPMAYDIMRRVSRKVGHGEALLGAFVVSVYSTYILESSVSLSESLIYFLTFFIFWCLVRFNQSGRLIWGILSGFAVGYLYIVHNRNLSIVIAFALVVLVYCVREKRAKKAVAMTVPVALMWILKLFVDKWLIAKEATGGIYTSNTYSSIADRYTNDFTLYRIISIFENVIGEAWYTYIGTMLIGGMGIYYIIKQLILCKKGGTESGKKEVELYLFAFFGWLFSVGISVLFVARGQVSYGGRIDNLIYGRYMENTVGILMLYGFIYGIELRKEQNRKDIRNKIIIMVMLAVILTSVTYILSLKSDPHKCNWFSIVAILMPLFKSDMKVPIVLSGMILGLLGTGVVLCITGSKKRHVVLGYLVMSVTFIYIGYNTTACVSQIYAEGKSLVNNPTYNEHFNDICGYIKNSDIDQLYVYTTDGYEAFSYQFVNNHMVVIGITGEEELGTISSDAFVLMKTAEIPKNISYEGIYSNGLYTICHINTEYIQKYNLELSSVTIDLDTVDSEYKFLYLSDNQANFDDREDLGWFGSSQSRVFADENGTPSADNFDYFISYANEAEVDAVLFGGDIIDFASEQNLMTLSKKLDELKVPYIYTYGNHDSYLPWENRFDDTNRQFLHLFKDNDCEFQCMELDGVSIVSIRNYQADGTANISKEALEQFKEVYEKDLPIVLMLHVPVFTDCSHGLVKAATDGKGDLFRSYDAGDFGTVYQSRLMGYNCGYELTEETKAFLDLIEDKNSPVQLVLAGHLHEGWSGNITDTTMEYVVDGAFNNKGIILTIK